MSQRYLLRCNQRINNKCWTFINHITIHSGCWNFFQLLWGADTSQHTQCFQAVTQHELSKVSGSTGEGTISSEQTQTHIWLLGWHRATVSLSLLPPFMNEWEYYCKINAANGPLFYSGNYSTDISSYHHLIF